MKIYLRKLLISFLSIATLIFVTSCGSKTEEVQTVEQAFEIYKNLSITADYLEDYTRDMVDAGSLEIYHNNTLTFDYIARDLNISTSELIYGATCDFRKDYEAIQGRKVDEAEFEYMLKYIEDYYFLDDKDSGFLMNQAIQNGYRYMDEYGDAKQALERARVLLVIDRNYRLDYYFDLNDFAMHLNGIFNNLEEVDMEYAVPYTSFKYIIRDIDAYQEYFDEAFAKENLK